MLLSLKPVRCRNWFYHDFTQRRKLENAGIITGNQIEWTTIVTIYNSDTRIHTACETYTVAVRTSVYVFVHSNRSVTCGTYFVLIAVRTCGPSLRMHKRPSAFNEQHACLQVTIVRDIWHHVLHAPASDIVPPSIVKNYQITRLTIRNTKLSTYANIISDFLFYNQWKLIW